MLNATEKYIPDIRVSDSDIKIVDIGFVSYEDRIRDIESRKDLCKFLSEEVDRLDKAIRVIDSKLQKLTSKFSIITNGDNLKPSYEIVFNNSSHFKGEDEISNNIMSNFIKDYGLDISELITDIRKFSETVTCIDMTTKNEKYCEVDLLQMSDKKEPVKC